MTFATNYLGKFHTNLYAPFIKLISSNLKNNHNINKNHTSTLNKHLTHYGKWGWGH